MTTHPTHPQHSHNRGPWYRRRRNRSTTGCGFAYTRRRSSARSVSPRYVCLALIERRVLRCACSLSQTLALFLSSERSALHIISVGSRESRWWCSSSHALLPPLPHPSLSRVAAVLDTPHHYCTAPLTRPTRHTGPFSRALDRRRRGTRLSSRASNTTKSSESSTFGGGTLVMTLATFLSRCR